jgi:pimeloyl-ACP methyl ester carboxylesterase
MSTAITSSAVKSTTVRLPVVLRLVSGSLRLLDRMAPRLATRIVTDLFLTPRSVPLPESETRWRASATRERRMLASLPVTTWSWGSGAETILLVHGWEGRGTQLGALAEALAAEGYRVVAPDFPAHGDSPGRRTNLIEFADIVAELIRELHPAAIVAHSFGAAATNVALRDTPFDGRLLYLAPPEDFAFFTASFGRILGLPAALAERIGPEIERRFDLVWSDLRGATLAPKMTAPLLVIHDEDDVDVPVRYGQVLAAAWPRAELMITRGLGHRRILRDPKVIAVALRFLAGRALH